MLNKIFKYGFPVGNAILVVIMMHYPNIWVIFSLGVAVSTFSYGAGWWRGYDVGHEQAKKFSLEIVKEHGESLLKGVK